MYTLGVVGLESGYRVNGLMFFTGIMDQYLEKCLLDKWLNIRGNGFNV
jgi:hypothetical protein